MTAAPALIGAALLLLGLLRIARTDGLAFAAACACCGTGGALLGWGLV